MATTAGTSADAEVERAKQAVRERTWKLLEGSHAARFPGARGRIPNFAGAEAAAERLAELPAWRSAHVIKANPDAPQLPVRKRALTEGRLLYMAVPRLAERQPFLRLDPRTLQVPPQTASSISGAARHGRPISVARMRRIDLVVCGSVAVNRRGQRVGKGGGFSDIEFALLREAGLVDDETTIATTVHDLQLVDDALPETDHDFRVDVVVTPTLLVRARRTRRPTGILWSHLDAEKAAAIPVLATTRPRGTDRNRPR
ncbi:MAG: 5-formyltetrahydrofolate cyclo-ligase [Actinomycetota bacterium]